MIENDIRVIVYKTNYKISMQPKLNDAFNKLYGIIKWTIDTEDADKVLRIETTNDLSKEYLSNLCQHTGLKIYELN